MRRVLVVEDEKSIREMIALNLRMSGWEVLEAESAEQGLDLLNKQGPCEAAVLDVMLHPSMVKGKEGPKVVADLVRTYFETGGLFIQFNILDVDTLRRARREPEKYSSVQIRVCGWNVRFIDLDPAAQELFIQEAESKSC